MADFIINVDSVDPAEVDRTIGPEFYTHLRLVPDLVEMRIAAIDRVHQRYASSVLAGPADACVEQLALLVLQRSILASEDLLALLHALRASDPWLALTGYTADDLDRMAKVMFDRRGDLEGAFRLPTDEQLAAPEEELDDVAQSATRNLRTASRARLSERLQRVAAFWLARQSPAKATMHGWPLISSLHLGGVTGGLLSEQVQVRPAGPFAVTLFSEVSEEHSHVETTSEVIELGATEVANFADCGKQAAGIARLIAEAQLSWYQSGRPFGLPLIGLVDLAPEDRAVLEPHLP